MSYSSPAARSRGRTADCRPIRLLPACPPRCAAGCDRLEAFGSLCQHKSDPFQPLAALQRLRSLDFTRCALEELPPWLGCLPQLATLMLGLNRLTTLPMPAAPVPPERAGGAAAGKAAGRSAGKAAAAAPLVAMPPRLEHLDLHGNGALSSLPPALYCARYASQLTHLDLSRCWKLDLTPTDWRQLLAALPRLRLLRHSCALLAAEVRGHGGAARLAAALGACPELLIEQSPPPERGDPALQLLHSQMLQHELLRRAAGGHGGGGRGSSPSGGGGGASGCPAGPSGGGSGGSGSSRQAHTQSCSSLDALEAEAAETLLRGGHAMRAARTQLADLTTADLTTASSGSDYSGSE